MSFIIQFCYLFKCNVCRRSEERAHVTAMTLHDLESIYHDTINNKPPRIGENKYQKSILDNLKASRSSLNKITPTDNVSHVFVGGVTDTGEKNRNMFHMIPRFHGNAVSGAYMQKQADFAYSSLMGVSSRVLGDVMSRGSVFLPV